MRTPIELRKSFKEETGNSFMMIEFAFKEIADDEEWNALTITEYIEWLEEKLINTQKQADEYIRLHNYKEDYDDALYEIGQLQDQLYDAEEEIRELNSTVNN